jgi:hypothetical protein
MATRKPIALVSGYFQEVNTPTDKLDFAGNTTTDLTEGSNLYYTDAKARGAITIANSGTGYGSLGYVSGTGVLTYTVVTDANIRGSLSVASGSGLTYSSSTGQFGTSSIPNSQLAFSSVTVGSTSISLGGTATTIAGLTAVTSTAFNVGTAGAANSITLDSTGIVFEGSSADTFETTLSVVNPTADQAINLPNASGTVALLTSLTGGNTGTGYGSLSYNNTTGAFTYSVVTDANIRGAVTAANSGTGYGSLAYSSATGTYTYTVVTDANIRGAVSVTAGSGLTYNSSTGAFGTSSIPNSQLANSSITLGSTSVALGSTATSLAGLTSVSTAAGSAAAPSFVVGTGTTYAPGIYSPGADQVALATNGTGRLFITQAGNVGIGTTSPSTRLHVDWAGGNQFRASNGSGTFDILNDTTNSILISSGPLFYRTGTAGPHIFQKDGGSSEVARIDGSGRLLVGTSTARSNFFGTTLSAVTQTEGTGGAAGRGALSVINNDVSNNPPYLLLGRSGAATLGSNAAVVNGSRLGTLTFQGADGTSFIEAATVAGEVDGTPGTTDMPGRLVFSTTADGAGSPTERMRIDSSGRVGIGTSSITGKVTVSGNAVGVVVALTDGATITPDFSAANYFSVTLGGNRTLANPSNQTAGQSGTIVITQDGTGGRTLAYGSNYKFAGGTVPTLTTTAGAVDTLAYYVESASRITCRLLNDVK